jgi:carbamoyl-phosphate synthase large subunit
MTKRTAAGSNGTQPGGESRSVNVVLVSAGRRVELTRALRRAYDAVGVEGRIVTLDVDPLAPAMHEADRSYLVPRLSDPAFLPALASICERERASLVVPLTDRDIPVLAAGRAGIEATGARVLLLPDEGVTVTMDKLLTHRFFLERGVPAPRSWSADEAREAELDYPLFIRPRRGSASEGAFPVRNRRELEFFLDYVHDPIVQEHLPGPEITTDVFSDFGLAGGREGRVLGAACRQRIEVRSGEVAKGVTVCNPEVLGHCVTIARALRAPGPVTVQCILRDGRPYFTEVNARFGGGAPLGLAAGMPALEWLLALAAGKEVDPPPLGSYTVGRYLTRYDDSFVLDQQDLHRRIERDAWHAPKGTR